MLLVVMIVLLLVDNIVTDHDSAVTVIKLVLLEIIRRNGHIFSNFL